MTVDGKKHPMRYRTLGNSGTAVSTYGLGTMTFGAEADEATSHQMIGDYVAAGGNLIDTADVYSAGASEEIIGRWLSTHPTEAGQVVIATKGRFPRDGDPTTSARPAATSVARWTRRCAAWAWSTSTCTSCTPGTP